MTVNELGQEQLINRFVPADSSSPARHSGLRLNPNLPPNLDCRQVKTERALLHLLGEAGAVQTSRYEQMIAVLP
jgi:hypothetical protein